MHNFYKDKREETLRHHLAHMVFDSSGPKKILTTSEIDVTLELLTQRDEMGYGLSEKQVGV